MKSTTERTLIFTKSGSIFRQYFHNFFFVRCTIIVNLVNSFPFSICPKLPKFFLVQTKGPTTMMTFVGFLAPCLPGDHQLHHHQFPVIWRPYNYVWSLCGVDDVWKKQAVSLDLLSSPSNQIHIGLM